MLQPGRRPRLPDEPFERGPITLRIKVLHLDRHVSTEHRVMRCPYLAHSS
jgi:hypothetical protein